MRDEMKRVILGSITGAIAVNLAIVACGNVEEAFDAREADAQSVDAPFGGGDAVPSGAVMHFNASACPSGWLEYTEARGRYLVGLPSGGTLAGTVGTALTDREDRPVGQHIHAVTDPGHGHGIQRSASQAAAGGSGGIYGLQVNSGTTVSTTQGETTNITIDASGTIAGTNAPFVQLLICQKA